MRKMYVQMVTPCLDYLRKGGVKVCECLYGRTGINRYKCLIMGLGEYSLVTTKISHSNLHFQNLYRNYAGPEISV